MEEEIQGGAAPLLSPCPSSDELSGQIVLQDNDKEDKDKEKKSRIKSSKVKGKGKVRNKGKKLKKDKTKEEGDNDSSNNTLSPRVIEEEESALSAEQRALEKEKKEKHLLEELLSSEADYVRDLSNCIEYYLKPVRKQKLLDNKTLDSIFSCLEVIYSVNKELLREFTLLLSSAAQASSDFNLASVAWQVGDVFIQMSTSLMVYENYLKNFTRSHIVLKNCVKKFPAFGHFCEDQRVNVKQLKLMHLRDFLIKPVQRLCKYPLFVKELLEVITVGSPEWRKLKICLSKIEELVSVLNDSKRQEETLESVAQRLEGYGSVLSIPGRFLCKEGKLVRFGKNWEKPKERYFFLFNDILICSKAKKGFMKARESYEYQSKISLSRLNPRDVPEEMTAGTTAGKSGLSLFVLEILSSAEGQVGISSGGSAISSPNLALSSSGISIISGSVSKVWHLGAPTQSDKLTWIYELTLRRTGNAPGGSPNLAIEPESPGGMQNRRVSLLKEEKKLRRVSEIVPYIRIFYNNEEPLPKRGSGILRKDESEQGDEKMQSSAPSEMESMESSCNTDVNTSTTSAGGNVTIADLLKMIEQLREEERERSAELRSFERLFNEERQKRVDLESEVIELKQRLHVEKIKRESSATILEKMLHDEQTRRSELLARVRKIERALEDEPASNARNTPKAARLSKGAAFISLFRSDSGTARDLEPLRDIAQSKVQQQEETHLSASPGSMPIMYTKAAIEQEPSTSEASDDEQSSGGSDLFFDGSEGDLEEKDRDGKSDRFFRLKDLRFHNRGKYKELYTHRDIRKDREKDKELAGQMRVFPKEI